jgi:hypothetical protein
VVISTRPREDHRAASAGFFGQTHLLGVGQGLTVLALAGVGGRPVRKEDVVRRVELDGLREGRRWRSASARSGVRDPQPLEGASERRTLVNCVMA